ncbi:hypothetical protein O181_055691 [Austropuccinia psidii MF-1]|uniref:Uncharacterized protein n=1 Tax=Austropuccinia psidii MF-1 TaxID=1389203 RepID=A0A9Q3EBV4_9BASI|nr:hypothetical protein [Austropuccinia psidii MF-1]
MSPVHLRDLGFQRHQPEDREGLSRTRRSGRGHLGNSGGWQDIEENHTHSSIHIPIQQKPQTRGLEGYGPRSSAPATPQRPFSMEPGQQEVQPGTPLGKTWSKFPEDLSQRDRLQRLYANHQGWNPTRKFRLLEVRANRIMENQATIQAIEEQLMQTGSFQEKTRTQQKKQDLFQLKAERVRPNYPEAVGFGEGSAQEPEVVVHNSRISSPINRNITPTQIAHNLVTPESNLNSDGVWLQMSQISEQAQKQFAELEASHERMKKLTAPMEKVVKTLQ